MVPDDSWPPLITEGTRPVQSFCITEDCDSSNCWVIPEISQQKNHTDKTVHEPVFDKTNKMTCEPSEDSQSDQSLLSV